LHLERSNATFLPELVQPAPYHFTIVLSAAFLKAPYASHRFCDSFRIRVIVLPLALTNSVKFRLAFKSIGKSASRQRSHWALNARTCGESQRPLSQDLKTDANAQLKLSATFAEYSEQLVCRSLEAALWPSVSFLMISCVFHKGNNPPFEIIVSCGSITN